MSYVPSTVKDITEGFPFPLSSRMVAAISASRHHKFDAYIGGLGFRLAPTDNTPYKREPVPVSKAQVDTSTEIGEQSLDNGWWLRSQVSFHLGAGAKYLDARSRNASFASTIGEDSRFRFDASAGVDVWTSGELRLLHSTTLIKATTGACYVAGGQATGDVFWCVDAGTGVTRENGASSQAIGSMTHAANNFALYTGSKVIVGHSTGADMWDPTDNAIDTHNIVSATGTVRAWWAKGRLFIARGPQLFEATLTGGDLDAPAGSLALLYTHPQAGWQWTGLAVTGAAAFISGYVGSNSALHSIIIDPATGTTPVLTAAVVAAELPEGEIVTGLYGYLGDFVAIGTNKGVRIGLAQGVNLTYGPLLFQTANPVYAFVGSDRFIYAGVQDFVDGKSGAVRIDLGAELTTQSPLTFAWATDVSTGVTGAVNSICLFGTSGRLVIGVEGHGAYLESATNHVASGWIKTGYIRYGMLEPKRFKRVRVAAELPASTSLALTSIQSDGDEVNIASLTDSSAYREVALSDTGATDSLALKFTLATTSAAATPVFKGYQLKALPAGRRNRMIQLPLYCYDRERDANAGIYGYKGRASEVLQALETVFDNADLITLSHFGITNEVLIESVQFQSTTPSSKAFDGFGGIVLLTVRTML